MGKEITNMMTQADEFHQVVAESYKWDYRIFQTKVLAWAYSITSSIIAEEL